MKARAEQEMVRRGLEDREVKRGRGGIRDIEFAIQLLQLVHGGLDAALRSPNTLDALREMAEGGYVDAEDADALAAAYRFLRTVEHRLQLVDELQVHEIPASLVAQTRLARTMGYRDTGSADALERFLADLSGATRRRSGRFTNVSTSGPCSRRSPPCPRAAAKPSCSAALERPRPGSPRSVSPPPTGRERRSAS